MIPTRIENIDKAYNDKYDMKPLSRDVIRLERVGKLKRIFRTLKQIENRIKENKTS